jgi:hypothetical protein
MDQRFFNRILHLVNTRPEEGRRMIGLSATALWELWQQMSELESAAEQEWNNHPARQRQAGGGRKKEALVLCRLLVTLLYLRQHWTMQALAAAMGCAESTVWN